MKHGKNPEINYLKQNFKDLIFLNNYVITQNFINSIDGCLDDYFGRNVPCDLLELGNSALYKKRNNTTTI
jgi:hypothetical protein